MTDTDDSSADRAQPAEPRIRVMIADDHALVRSGLAQLLATAGDLELVAVAEDGEMAVSLATEFMPDVVLMDLSMPGIDGVTATRRIVAETTGVHVLVLTSFSDRTRIVDAIAAGAEGYLLKQSEPETILTGIRDLIRGGSPLDPTAARVLLTEHRPTPEPASELTAREKEVLLMVREGLPNKSIARRLGITERTVKAHLTSTFQRLGVPDRTQAALWAERNL
jgi:DNA-binding NarL/FixJ family response regulator